MQWSHGCELGLQLFLILSGVFHFTLPLHYTLHTTLHYPPPLPDTSLDTVISEGSAVDGLERRFPVACPSGATDILVDVVAGSGARWYKMTARNHRALHKVLFSLVCSIETRNTTHSLLFYSYRASSHMSMDGSCNNWHLTQPFCITLHPKGVVGAVQVRPTQHCGHGKDVGPRCESQHT